MFTRYNSYCPHCNCTLERGRRTLKTSGCPIQECPECGKTYCDPYCFESALRPYKPYPLIKFLFAALYWAFLTACLVSLITVLVTRTTEFPWLVMGISLGAIWLIILIYYLMSRQRIEENHLREWQESDRRLHDGKYAALLKAVGFQVPSHYLPEDYQPVLPDVPPRVKTKKRRRYLPPRWL